MEKGHMDSSKNEEKVMTFNLGKINHPKYGKADHMTGEIQFVLPSGVYKYPTILKDPAKFEKVVSTALPACRDLWPNLLDEEILAKLKELVYATSLATKLDLCEEKGLSILYAFIFGFSLDDFVDLEELPTEMNETSSHDYTRYMELMRRTMWQEEVAKFGENSPSLTAELEVVKNFLLKADICRKSLECNEALDEFLTTIYAHVIVNDLKKAGLHFSYATSLYFDRYVHGIIPYLERIAYCEDVILNATIRNDLLFKALLEKWADIITFVNAILGFLRDMELGQESGPLMYLILKKKLGLQEAFDGIYSQLQDAFKDYKICSEKLLRIYDNDGNVGKYIEVMGYILDGFLHGYQGATRYGLQGKLKIETK